jgi:hypothetical protein
VSALYAHLRSYLLGVLLGVTYYFGRRLCQRMQ